MEKYKEIKIIYEDNHILVVLKPAGIPSQGDKTGDQDMLSILKEYIKEKYNKPGDVFLGLVHRLDRMTSGIMVFARTSKAASRLSQYIREGNFKKKYLAALCGKIDELGEKRILENYLFKDERTNISKVTDKSHANSKLAKLTYKIIGYTEYKNQKYSYVEVELFTGRHHQIRVQFSNIEYPLYGDVKYGSDKNKPGNNLALFAYYLSFPHPTKDEWLEFKEYPVKEEIWGELSDGNNGY